MKVNMLEKLVRTYPELAECVPDIQTAFDLLTRAFAGGGKLLVCGNGGSAADSEHIVGELMKSFNLPRPIPGWIREKLVRAFPGRGQYLADHLQAPLPALSLVSQTSLLSAYGNDVAPDMGFAQQVLGYGREGDALIAISTSGRSANVLNAVRVARAVGVVTVGLTGRGGGTLKELCDVTILVPCNSTADVQERHLGIYHALCAMLEQEFFANHVLHDGQDRQAAPRDPRSHLP